MKILKEAITDLYKGIFWIIDIDNPSDDYIYTIPCDYNGNVISETSYELNAKSGNTYNHEKFWNSLPKKLQLGVKYNYYPRGRVEINNGKATIYLNKNIATEEIKDFIVKNFHLFSVNNIKKVNMIVDGSEHYKCYLD